MGDPHGDPQTSPRHADPHALGAFFRRKHTRDPRGSASCGGQISPWAAREVTDKREFKLSFQLVLEVAFAFGESSTNTVELRVSR